MSGIERATLAGFSWSIGLIAASFLPIAMEWSAPYSIVPLLLVVPFAFVRVVLYGARTINFNGRRDVLVFGLATSALLIALITSGFIESYRARVIGGIPSLTYRGQIVRQIDWDEYRRYSNGFLRLMSGFVCFLYGMMFIAGERESR